MRGSGRAAVEVLPGRLPALRERSAPSLDQLRESVAAINHDDAELIPKDWDVFISHASQDKDEIVRPLAIALQEQSLRVWYDEFELRIGDSLRRKIDQGIARSAFGIVVLGEGSVRHRGELVRLVLNRVTSVGRTRRGASRSTSASRAPRHDPQGGRPPPCPRQPAAVHLRRRPGRRSG
ncbi:MAG: toll/interleukin-1 receptor domain-containing protein [Pseudonocardiaceae bacterium]